MTIPTGTLVSICPNNGEKRWKAHTTTKELRFDQEYRDSHTWDCSGAVIFEQDGWLLLTQWKKVSRRANQF